MTDEVSTLDSLLKSLHVNVSRAWLESCIGWCKEETLPPTYTLKQLQNSVLEQWLLLDLRDLEIPSLPPNISQKKKYILNGTFSLQLMYVMDVSKPKHWQLQRIRNGIQKNLDQEAENSKRMLLLCLTDGVQEVFGSEYHPIPCFNINMCPGLKIKLKGPIDVRQGRLMLKAENVKLLGGEVDSLVIPNAAENILAKQLNLPLNPKPNVISESLLVANETSNSSVVHSSYANVNQTAVPTMQNVTVPNLNRASVLNLQNDIVDDFIANVNEISMSIPQTAVPSLNRAPVPNLQNDIEDNLISEDDMQLLMELHDDDDFEVVPPPKKVEKTVSKTQKVCASPDMFEDMDLDADLAKIEVPPTIIKLPEEKSGGKNPQNTGLKIEHHNINQNLNKTSTRGMDVEDVKKDSLSPKVNRSANRTEENFVSPPIKTNICLIAKLLNNLPNISKGKFKIKGKFVTVVEKMTVNDDGYLMVVKVKDDSGDISLGVADEVMAGAIGYTAKEFMGFKEAILKECQEAEAKVLEALKRLKFWLLRLDNILEVQVDREQKIPFIVKVL
ncbi:unnamed protein product [Callosobruchus maculatus]|uniref:RecQ-mediated genome instability protein 1 n=1 Tax=Callosobruchus maculatus TaxID=64391 RepID=A0A653BS97_CALMS|nr:unnamed protein product [Callosobruchus maculatus]